MKKILISLALSIICLAVTVGSFLTNDVAAYKKWVVENHAKIMAPFDMGKPGPRRQLPPPPPEGPRMAPPEGPRHEKQESHHGREEKQDREEKK